MKVSIVSRSGREIAVLDDLANSSSILQVKEAFERKNPKYYVSRQQLKLGTDKKDKALKDEDTLQSLGVEDGGKLYFKDLGPQIGWKTVFLTEYAGPLVCYLMFYQGLLGYLRTSDLAYGEEVNKTKRHLVVQVAALCWSFHYIKRLLETLLVHRFSHATMPVFNIFKNSSYYWGFAAYVGYYVNHPLFTPPKYGDIQVGVGLMLFIICELGNLSIHVALRNLRPPGTKVRKIPQPTANPMTWLFYYVSCPNYTYEFGAWIGFTIMTQSIPSLLFALAGFYQMAVWAMGKHRNYIKEFPNYPKKQRKAIIPFLF